mgnify:CR=1 FL=1
MIKEIKPKDPIKTKFAILPTKVRKQNKEYIIWWEKYYAYDEQWRGMWLFHKYLDKEEALNHYNGDYE